MLAVATSSDVSHSLFIAVYAILWSCMEIEMEGADGGWAANMPTVPSGIGRFTVYHVIMNAVVVLTVAYALRDSGICSVVFYVAAWFLIEDFCWFVLNPAYTLSRYTRESVWWHAHQPWPLGIPAHNWVGIVVMFVAGMLGGASVGGASVLAVAVAGVVLLAPCYHAWYKKKRR